MAQTAMPAQDRSRQHGSGQGTSVHADPGLGRNEDPGQPHAADPLHDHAEGDLSKIHEGLELNPRHHHPPNAETHGIWKILRYSTVGAIIAMVVVLILGYALFS